MTPIVIESNNEAKRYAYDLACKWAVNPPHPHPLRIGILIDAQNDFVTGTLPAENGTQVIKNCVDFASAPWDILIATKDTHSTDYLDTFEGKKLPIVHCIKDTDGWKLVPAVHNAINSSSSSTVVIPKRTFGSEILHTFLTTVRKFVRQYEVHIAGFVTDICVLSNAVLAKTACPTTPITIHAHCCAGTSAQAHANALEMMKGLHMDIVTKMPAALIKEPQHAS